MSDRLVLLAIAHRVSNDDGEAFPSIARIVKETLLSERQVYDSIKILVEMGELEVLEEKSQYGTNRYRMPICLSWLQSLHPAQNAGVQNVQRKGAKPLQDMQETPAQNADEPSLNHKEENHQAVGPKFPKPTRKEKAKKGYQFNGRQERPARQPSTPARKAPPDWEWFAILFKRYTDKIPVSNPTTWDALEEMLREIDKEEAEGRLSTWTEDRGKRIDGWAARDFLSGEWKLVSAESREPAKFGAAPFPEEFMR